MSSQKVQEICARLIANDPALTELSLDDDEFDSDDWTLVFDALKRNVVVSSLVVKLGELSWDFMMGLEEVVWNPTVKGIAFRDVNSFEQLGALAVAYKRNENLCRLEFNHCRITPEVHAFLKELLTANAIESLSLLELRGLDFSNLYAAFRKTTSLKNLHVSLWRNAPRVPLLQVPYIIQLTESLESLELRVPTDMSYILARVAQAATGHKSLESFKCGSSDYSHAPLDEDSASAIETMICLSPVMKELELTFIDLQPSGARHLAAGLASRDCNIQKLRLPYCRIGDLEVGILFGALVTNRSVTELDLSKNRIGDGGAIALGSVLARNNVILTLNMMGNAIEDDGAVALASMLARKNRSVTKLDLRLNRIGDDGAIALGSMLEENNIIDTLDLSQNWIHQNGALALANGFFANTSLRHVAVTPEDEPVRTVGDDAASRFAEKLADPNSTVESIEIEGFGVDGLMAFIRHLPNMQNVVKLGLWFGRLREHDKPTIIDALVGAIEQNTIVQHLELSVHLFEDNSNDDRGKLSRIEYLLDLNRGGRHRQFVVRSAPEVPLGLWPLILGRDDCSKDAMYYLLSRKPDVIMSRANSRPRKRKRDDE